MDGKDGLQLLPGTKKRLGIKVPGENRFLYVGSAILGAVLVALFYLNHYENNLRGEIKNLNDQLTALEQKRNKKDESELKLTKDRLAATSSLIRDHVYWTQAFSWLESMLQREVQLKDVALLNSQNKIQLSGFAANYIVVARQIAALLNDNRVKEAQVGKMTSISDGTIQFSMDITIDFSKIIKKN